MSHRIALYAVLVALAALLAACVVSAPQNGGETQGTANQAALSLIHI